MKEKKIIIVLISLLILNLILFKMNKNKKEKLENISQEYKQFIENVQITKQLKENYLIKENIVINESQNFIFEEYINKALEEIGIKKRVLYFKPVKTNNNEDYIESEYEIKIEDVGMKELINFFYKIENEKKIIKVNNVKMTKNSKLKYKFDVIINLKYFKKNI